MKRRLLLAATWGATWLGVMGGCSTPSTPLPLGEKVDGLITFYDSDGRGACGYDATGDDFAAIDTPQWGGSAACGTCIEVTGPKGVLVVRVVDRCPECQFGHLDLRRSSFAKIADLSAGRVAVTWQPVSCPVSGNLRLQLKDGSNPFWSAVQVRNHRRPVQSLEANKGGVWKRIARTDYNYFVDEQGFGQGPIDVKVTADDGSVVNATIATVQAGLELEAAGQF